ncbi:MAG: hypothetical protein JWN46_1095 [Acidimicrobiales bacterium]|nr:hypothetical protein [Acidimicrobiales bacterium]
MTAAITALARRPAPSSRPGVALNLEAFARASGLHPDLVRRLVTLGVLDPIGAAAGELWFPPAQLAAAARLQRLRSGLALNYAALRLVMDLLDRIQELEARGPAGAPQRASPRTTPDVTGGGPWMQTG